MEYFTNKTYEGGFDMIWEGVTFLGVVSIISFRTHLEMDGSFDVPPPHSITSLKVLSLVSTLSCERKIFKVLN